MTSELKRLTRALTGSTAGDIAAALRATGKDVVVIEALSSRAPEPAGREDELLETVGAAIRRVTGCADITAGELSLKVELVEALRRLSHRAGDEICRRDGCGYVKGSLGCDDWHENHDTSAPVAGSGQGTE